MLTQPYLFRPSTWRYFLRRFQAFTRFLQELSRYLLYLRVPIFFLTLSEVAFLSSQVTDVLLGIALEPDWVSFCFAAVAGAVFGITLWFSARALSELRWMDQPPQPLAIAGAHCQATPRCRFMPAWVVWWIPRFLGIAPLVFMALALVRGVGDVGMSFPMAFLLLLEAITLLILLYLRTRLAVTIRLPGRLLSRVVEAITVSSGIRDGLFTPRTELFLFGLAWLILSTFSLPIALSANASFSSSLLHLYVVLLAGVVVLVVRRIAMAEKPPIAYWIAVSIVLVLALLLPLLLLASSLSAVALPRLLGSITILYISFTIFTILVSSLYIFGTQLGVPLLTLLFLSAIIMAVYRVNDNHAVRYLEGPAPQPLPSLESSLERWFESDDRLNQIESLPDGKKWPLYIVSSQGGGVYAAYHSSKALALLTEQVPEFRRHLLAVSGVSGGSVGAAIYENALYQVGTGPGIVDLIDSSFDHDHLSPVLAAMLLPDLIQRFYPMPVAAWDRALALELSFSDPRDQTPHVSLEHSFFASQSGPFVVFNTTIVTNGRRLLLSPFTFDSDAIFHSPLAATNGDLLSQDIRFSTAAGMSARFPLISPYAFFDGSPQQRGRRLVDGGYYDNAGVVTAAEIKNNVLSFLDEKALLDKVEVMPIAIVNKSSFRHLEQMDRDASAPSRSLDGPIFPFSSIQALFSARDARVAKALSDFGVSCGNGAESGLCITLETKFRLIDEHQLLNALPRNIPLGWTLSCQARTFISSQLNPDPGSPAQPPPCLSFNRGSGLLEVADSSLESFPSFAHIVQSIRDQV